MPWLLDRSALEIVLKWFDQKSFRTASRLNTGVIDLRVEKTRAEAVRKPWLSQAKSPGCEMSDTLLNQCSMFYMHLDIAKLAQ